MTTQTPHEKQNELKLLIKDFPELPGVYLMKNAHSKVIYVGKAKNLKARVRSYLSGTHDQNIKTLYLVSHIEFIEFIVTHTEVEAFLLEASLIKKYRPRYNIRLKDDKAYPYIRVSMKDLYPRFYLQRKVVHDGSLYFGPYTSGSAVRDMIRFINGTFKIRDCSDHYFAQRKRPCMTHQMGRCTAPCVELISPEEYQKEVKSALRFLQGKSSVVISQIKKEMKRAAHEERFESAARLRDSLMALQVLQEKQNVVSIDGSDIDVFAYWGDERGTVIETLHVRSGQVIGNRSHFFPKLNPHHSQEEPKEWLTSFINQYYVDNYVPDEIYLPVDLGGDLIKLLGEVFWERAKKRPFLRHTFDVESKKLLDMAFTNAQNHFLNQIKQRDERLEALQEIKAQLQLPELPLRMECFDISHFQGGQTVASQVVFEEGQPRREDYRKYKIKSIQGPDDFASMKEVLSRRLQHQEWEDPQLIVVDGGKGQLKMAVEVLKDLGRTEIPVVGMAKARTEGDFKDQEIHHSQERFFIPGRQNPITFRRHSKALQVLVQLRDEAHRVAIQYHRQLRDKNLLTSVLDGINGLGDKKKKYLLTQFASVEEIQQAGVDKIASLKGFNYKLAVQIIDALKLNSPLTPPNK